MPKPKFTPELDAQIEEFRKEKGFPFFNEAYLEALREFFNGKTVCDKSVSEKCQACPLFGGFFNEKITCVLKLENKQPTIKHRSLLEAQACSTMPTLITLERKNELMQEMHNVENREKYWKEQAEKVRKPTQDLLAEKATLTSRCSELQNALVTRLDEISTLKKEKEQLKKLIEELSHDTLVEKNAFLTVELGNKDKEIRHLKAEAEKLDALVRKEKQEKADIISQVSKLLREIKAPTLDLTQCNQCLEGYDIVTFAKDFRKKIDDFVGYLNTVAQ
jgi:DNA repair exonuclease SbcCD ATPase subunit